MERECAACGLPTRDEICPSCEYRTREILEIGDRVQFTEDAIEFYGDEIVRDQFHLGDKDLALLTMTVMDRVPYNDEPALYTVGGFPISLYPFDLEKVQ